MALHTLPDLADPGAKLTPHPWSFTEGDSVIIFGPSPDVYRGRLGKVQKVPAKNLLEPVADPQIVVELAGCTHMTTVQCPHSSIQMVYG